MKAVQPSFNLVMSHRHPPAGGAAKGGRAKHRTGTPGLTPFRSRIIDAGVLKRRPARHLKRTARRIAGSHVALALAGSTALVLLVLSGYQAAEGAAILLGMF